MSKSKVMPALTFTQPWASIIMISAKRYETRSWRPAEGAFSQFVVHASATFGAIERHLMFEYPFYHALAEKGIDTVPTGVALGIVKLGAIHKTEDIAPQLNRVELAFGNYEAGRYAWELEVVEVFERPIPCRGNLGFWGFKFP